MTDTLKIETPLEGLLGYAMKRALSVVQADLAITLAPFDLRATSFSALMVVVERPGITQTDLAEALAIERSNLVQIVDELCSVGRIARTPFQGDRRRHALMPTPKGLAVAAQAGAAVAAHEARVFGGLTGAECKVLGKLLAKVRAVSPQ